MAELKTQREQSVSPEAAAMSGRDLTVGSIPRHLVLFSLPMLAGNVLQMAYQFVNLVWVGQYLHDPNAIPVLTVTMPAFFALLALCIGLTMATTILTSQHYGAKDFAALRRVVCSSSLMLGILSLIVLGIGELFAGLILQAMRTQEPVLSPATTYMRILLLSVPMGVGMALVRSMLQGIGDSRTPLYFQTGSLVLTAALDPVLMFGWLGLPALGVNGTAWATVISQVATMWALIAYLKKRNSLVAPSLRREDFHWPTAWKTVRIGLPAAVQHTFISLSMVFVTGVVNGFGQVAVAAFGVASRGVDMVAFLPAMSFNMAISAMTGQNLGADHPNRVRQIFWWGCILCGGTTLAISAIAVAFPEALLRIFTPDQAIIDMGVHYLRIVGASYVLFGIMFVSNGIINGAGQTIVPTVFSLVSLWAFRVPLAAFLSRWMGSVDGVWYAIAGSFGASMLLSVGYYSTGRWRRGVFQRRTAPPTSEEMFAEETGEA